MEEVKKCMCGSVHVCSAHVADFVKLKSCLLTCLASWIGRDQWGSTSYIIIYIQLSSGSESQYAPCTLEHSPSDSVGPHMHTVSLHLANLIVSNHERHWLISIQYVNIRGIWKTIQTLLGELHTVPSVHSPLQCICIIYDGWYNPACLLACNWLNLMILLLYATHHVSLWAVDNWTND